MTIQFAFILLMIFIILSLQVKAIIDAHEGDLDVTEAACAELHIGLDDAGIMPSPRVPKGKGKRTQDDDDALPSPLDPWSDPESHPLTSSPPYPIGTDLEKCRLVHDAGERLVRTLVAASQHPPSSLMMG